MDYHRFKQLIKEGEKKNIDFKIECNAFAVNKIAPRAELAKDICAMSNNGEVTSYILIGISDDGKNFKSVLNKKLTEDRLQDFCKKAIFPPPSIKLYKECWRKAMPNHKDKVFLIIQIGPHVRKAFRLIKDFVCYKEKVCFRRNDVWIRRGSTTDIATPEETANLIKRKKLEYIDTTEGTIEYLKLPFDEQDKAIVSDLHNYAHELDGDLYLRKDKYFSEDLIVIPINKKRFVWKCLILDRCSLSGFIDNLLLGRLFDRKTTFGQWKYEHGLIYLVKSTVAERALPSYVDMKFKESWGWFIMYKNLMFYDFQNNKLIPDNTMPFPFPVFVLPNIKDSNLLKKSLNELVFFLSDQKIYFTKILHSRNKINANYKRWLRDGWIYPKCYSESRPPHIKLDKDELFNRRSNFIMQRTKPKHLINMAKDILDLTIKDSAKLRSLHVLK